MIPLIPTPLQIILPAVVLLATALILGRRALSARRSRSCDVSVLPQELGRLVENGSARIQRLERGLEDYSREIEDRIDASAALIDDLSREFDEEIARLETLLQESRGAHPHEVRRPAERRLTAEQRRMICFLAMAGFASVEIARLARCPVEQIRRLLADNSRGAAA